MNLKYTSAIAMKHLKFSSIAITIFNLNGIALAQQQLDNRNFPELQPLQYFEGSWSCRQPTDSIEISGQFNWTVKPALNNRWYIGKSQKVRPSSLNSQIVIARDFFGYNKASEKLVRSVIIDNGNSYKVTATNWQSNQLVWDGTLIEQEQTMPFRQIIEKDSRYKFTATYFLLDSEQTWKPIVEETCIRIN